ncbi:hypothetical protein HNO86_13445 [Pseudomonas sp. C1C7]|uniref:hypothetical protein n=1 Tax=Pseudomonas sp. C1C7 TaxID=2735272 RepID=UPI00158690BE|nr:hypothetical protein [Pseudomonas sp. C1C7]NUT76051.1 hypothetical protein [Pseudomonas sp. C1C7]
MFSTAGLYCVRHVLFVLLMLLLVCACVHPPKKDPAQSAAELYADLIKPGVFERSSSKTIDGYLIESGHLRLPDKSTGSLVSVRSSDGSLSALVNRPGASGLLLIDNKGVVTFQPEPVLAIKVADAVPNPGEKVAISDQGKADPRVIDVLIGYSRAAVAAVGGDVRANALAQVESVNLSLRNLQVSDVSLRLVGTQVVAVDYPISVETLEQVPVIFAEGIANFEPDVIYGVFTYKGEPVTGQGYLPGRTAIGNPFSPTLFARELGHNAGAVTADSARAWRESTGRLSSYAHFAPKIPQSFTFTSASFGTVGFRWLQSPRAVKYEVMGKEPLLEGYKKLGESTTPDIVLYNVPNAKMPYYVVAVFGDGSKSGPSNVVYAKPYENVLKN